jgi:hypothetical protein
MWSRGKRQFVKLEDQALRLVAVRCQQFVEARGETATSEELWRMVADRFSGLRSAAECQRRWQQIGGGAEPGVVVVSSEEITG